jgi:hypothetical protein
LAVALPGVVPEALAGAVLRCAVPEGLARASAEAPAGA